MPSRPPLAGRPVIPAWTALLLFCVGCTGSVPSGSPPPMTTPAASSSPSPSSAPVSRPAQATATAEPETVRSAPPEESIVLATQASGDSLAFLNPADAADPVVDSVVVGQAPWDVYVAGREAFVSTAEGVAVVDLAERRRTAVIPYANPADRIAYGEYRPGGTGLVASSDGGLVYVAVLRADGTSVLEKIDVSEGRTVGSVEVGLRPFDVLLSEDGSELFTVDHDSFSVHVVDTATLAARRIEVAPFGTQGGLGSWEKPHYGAIDDAGNLLLPYQGLALAVVDPATGSVTVEEMGGNSHQHGTAIVGDTLLVIGTGAFGNATGSPNLTLRDLVTGGEEIVPLERLHETVVPWVHPETGSTYALLSGGYTRDGFWDGITVIDLGTLEKQELAVPGRPQALAVMP